MPDLVEPTAGSPLLAAHAHGQDRQPIQPLDDFYAREGRPLLPFSRIEGESIPEPYRTLLVHQRDMTRTLEHFHHGSIHLRVLSSRRESDNYWRESILQLDGSLRPIEYGAIKIYLGAVPEPGRSQILAEHLPLGGILNTNGIQYTSRPSAYFHCDPDSFIRAGFHLGRVSHLYGRQNTLRLIDGSLLAEIIEILPPV
ncbi:MAG TPA: hypothetical protein VMF06_08890 [Candidatus Limnocylindria bacterium]|jgi:hypothetical protein|nr:hypothetical protein [Candidatus Limnocylindria bacterium]